MGINAEIARARETLKDLVRRPLRYEKEQKLKAINERDAEHKTEMMYRHDWLSSPIPELQPAYGDVARAYIEKDVAIKDPTTLPGLEKRSARYPQFYSRIGFVHDFRPRAAAQIRQLLEQRWAPAGVKLLERPWDSKTAAAIIRITGGNFRLLNRLLTRTERIPEINGLAEVTKSSCGGGARKSRDRRGIECRHLQTCTPSVAGSAVFCRRV